MRSRDFLHGFLMGRGMDTAILELKLAHYLSRFDQDPLFLFFWTSTKPMTLFSVCVSLNGLLSHLPIIFQLLGV